MIFLAGKVLTLSKVPRGPMALDVVDRIEATRSSMRAARSPERILLVGDSVVNQQLPIPIHAAMEDELGRIAGTGFPQRVYPLSWPGWSILGEYCVGDEMLRMNPTRVVLEVNLRGLAVPAAYGPGFPELSGYIHPFRFLEALGLPLSQAGVTANRALYYRLLVASGATPLWKLLLDVQARLYRLREPVERAVEDEVGVHSWQERRATYLRESLRLILEPGKYRESRAHALSTLGIPLRGFGPTYPPMLTLGALLRRFVEANKRPLVWIAPLNVEHLHGLGIDTAGVDRSVESIRKVVEDSGATLLDLHAALPDDAFADPADHPTSEGERSGTDIVGVRLARALLASGSGGGSGLSGGAARADAPLVH
jgi:hypothetical protein